MCGVVGQRRYSESRCATCLWLVLIVLRCCMKSPKCLVIGREFSYELSAALELMSKDALSKGLQAFDLIRGLATCNGEIPNAVYTFSHALVQDAAYDSLLKRQAQAVARRYRPPIGGALARNARGCPLNLLLPITTPPCGAIRVVALWLPGR